MRCRYCGENLRSINQKLLSGRGEICNGSSDGKHIAVSEDMLCVYCGNSCRSMNGKLFTKYGEKCPASPFGRHCLQ